MTWLEGREYPLEFLADAPEWDEEFCLVADLPPLEEDDLACEADLLFEADRVLNPDDLFLERDLERPLLLDLCCWCCRASSLQEEEEDDSADDTLVSALGGTEGGCWGVTVDSSHGIKTDLQVALLPCSPPGTAEAKKGKPIASSTLLESL